MSIYLCMSACIQEPVATNSKQVTDHEFCTDRTEKCLVTVVSTGGGITCRPSLRGGEELLSQRGGGGGGCTVCRTIGLGRGEGKLL